MTDRPTETLRRQIEDKFFVAGQMDAQGSAAEKRKIGSGGTVLSLSKRLLVEAREGLDQLAAHESRSSDGDEHEKGAVVAGGISDPEILSAHRGPLKLSNTG